MAHRLAREVSALAVLLALSGALWAAQATPAAADHFLTHGDALKLKPTLQPAPQAQPVPMPVPPAQQARADAQDTAARLGRVVIEDANVYLAPQAAGDDSVLQTYSADTAPQAKAEGVAVPGLLGIAAQAYRAQAANALSDDGATPQAYSLADAMRDAIWRKQTARRLRDLFAD